MWHGDVSAMSQSHGIKGGATDEAFQEQRTLWESGASVGADFLALLNAYICKDTERKE